MFKSSFCIVKGEVYMSSRKDKKGRVLRKGESFRTKDEMYVYTYSDPFGKRRYIYAKDLIKLREKEEQLQRDQLDGINSYVAGNTDLNYIFDRYMATKNDLRISTKSNYLVIYDRYVREEFGKKKIADIKYSDILFFYNYLMEKKDLHIGTIEYIQRIIRPSLEMAVRDNVIRANPATGVIQQLKKNTKLAARQKRHALTIEQQRAFLSYVEETPDYYRWKALFVVLFGTGCRIGEALGLTWDDIDFESREINIQRSMYYFAGKQNTTGSHWIVNPPKSEAGKRKIPMVDTVFTALIEEKCRQEEFDIRCTTEVDNISGFVFCNRFNALMNPESVNKMIHRIVENYNSSEEIKAAKEKREPVIVPYFSCHYIRHTYCVRLCEADCPIKVMQSLMGHRDIQTTLDIYAEVTEEKKQKSLEKIFDEMMLF